MSTRPKRTQSVELRYVAAVLRLTMRPNGRLVHGAILDVAGRRVGRFVRWAELVPALRAWLAGRAQGSVDVDE